MASSGSAFIAKIEEGLKQSDAGQLVSHGEVKKQFLSGRDQIHMLTVHHSSKVFPAEI